MTLFCLFKSEKKSVCNVVNSPLAHVSRLKLWGVKIWLNVHPCCHRLWMQECSGLEGPWAIVSTQGKVILRRGKRIKTVSYTCGLYYSVLVSWSPLFTSQIWCGGSHPETPVLLETLQECFCVHSTLQVNDVVPYHGAKGLFNLTVVPYSCLQDNLCD